MARSTSCRASRPARSVVSTPSIRSCQRSKRLRPIRRKSARAFPGDRGALSAWAGRPSWVSGARSGRATLPSRTRSDHLIVGRPLPGEAAGRPSASIVLERALHRTILVFLATVLLIGAAMGALGRDSGADEAALT